MTPGTQGLPQGLGLPQERRGCPRAWGCPKNEGVAPGLGVAPRTKGLPQGLGLPQKRRSCPTAWGCPKTKGVPHRFQYTFVGWTENGPSAVFGQDFCYEFRCDFFSLLMTSNINICVCFDAQCGPARWLNEQGRSQSNSTTPRVIPGPSLRTRSNSKARGTLLQRPQEHGLGQGIRDDEP